MSTIRGISRYGHIAVRRSRLTAIQPHELGAAERLGVHVEADERGRGILGQVEPGDLERIQPEEIMVRLARRRARSAVAAAAEVGAALNCALGQEALLRIPGAAGE